MLTNIKSLVHSLWRTHVCALVDSCVRFGGRGGAPWCDGCLLSRRWAFCSIAAGA